MSIFRYKLQIQPLYRNSKKMCKRLCKRFSLESYKNNYLEAIPIS